MSRSSVLSVFVAVLSSSVVCSNAFAVVPMTKDHISSATRSTSTCALFAEQQQMTRRIFGATASIFAAGCLTAATAPTAYADVTNKVASTAAIRAVKRAVKDLEKAEFPCVNNEYADAKGALRTPGLNEVRKNCLILIRGGEDGPDAEDLKTSYDSFVKAIEALDTQASLGMRGRKNIELASYYDSSVKTLKDFLNVGERSATIPMKDVAE